jgi:hypothetical protein
MTSLPVEVDGTADGTVSASAGGGVHISHLVVVNRTCI